MLLLLIDIILQLRLNSIHLFGLLIILLLLRLDVTLILMNLGLQLRFNVKNLFEISIFLFLSSLTIYYNDLFEPHQLLLVLRIQLINFVLIFINFIGLELQHTSDFFELCTHRN